ncbi:MAG: GyrI-like domain-containing protein, partial [Anaerolineae bacterium]|nr:GyrI-like domain-containing protein [Anaerolineae bacterium]
MTFEHGRIKRHDLDDTLVAALRFRGQREDIAPAMQRLRDAAGSQATGPGIAITHDVNPDTGRDIELCIPVSQRITADGITCRVLPGGPWLAITHIGPQDFDDAEYGIMATVGQLVAYIRQYHIGIAEDPSRIVWIAGPAGPGTNKKRYVTEVQPPLLKPRCEARYPHSLEHNAKG